MIKNFKDFINENYNHDDLSIKEKYDYIINHEKFKTDNFLYFSYDCSSWMDEYILGQIMHSNFLSNLQDKYDIDLDVREDGKEYHFVLDRDFNDISLVFDELPYNILIDQLNEYESDDEDYNPEDDLYDDIEWIYDMVAKFDRAYKEFARWIK